MLIEDNEIKKVGNVEDEDVDKILDAEGKLVMPGLVCAHTRPYRILLWGASLNVESPSDYAQILQRVWWPLDEKLSKKDIYASALASCLEFIRTGTTFFACTHSSQECIGKSLDQIASAVEESGLRAFIGFEASERHTHAKGARGMRENIRFLESRENKKLKERRVRGMVGLHMTSTVSDELLRHGGRVADRFDVPIVVPTTEGRMDLYSNLRNHGKRTVERLRDVGVLSSNTVLTHCVEVNRDELSMVRKADAKIAYNPVSNLLNAMGGTSILERGGSDIPIGLGNDGYLFDGFENVRLLYLSLQPDFGGPRSISPMEVLEMATIRAAELYGMEDKIGSIEPGKRADVIILNPSNSPTPLRRENAAAHIVKGMKGSDVETVLVGGDIVMEDRRIKTLDEKRVIEKSRKRAEKIWKKFEAI